MPFVAHRVQCYSRLYDITPHGRVLLESLLDVFQFQIVCLELYPNIWGEDESAIKLAGIVYRGQNGYGINVDELYIETEIGAFTLYEREDDGVPSSEMVVQAFEIYSESLEGVHDWMKDGF